MTILKSIGKEFKSFGSFINSNLISPFTNKVLSPIAHAIITPIKTVINISDGVEQVSEIWAKRAGNLTNDTIHAADKTIKGIGDLFSTPIIPLIAGLAGVYIITR